MTPRLIARLKALDAVDIHRQRAKANQPPVPPTEPVYEPPFDAVAFQVKLDALKPADPSE